jgi:hypothetical protein
MAYPFSSDKTAFSAPLNLKEPLRWKFSHLNQASVPELWLNDCERSTGV